jgi:signal transduction histidine kinase
MNGRQHHQRPHHFYGPGFHGQGGPWALEELALEYQPRRLPAPVRLWLPVILSFLVQVPAAVLLWRHRELPVMVESDPLKLLIGVSIALIGPIALIFARRFPGPVVAIISVAALVDLFLGDSNATPPYIALAFAIGSAVNRGARLWAWLSVAIGWLLAITVGTILQTAWQPGRIVGTTFGILIVFGIAEAMRNRRERIAQIRARVAARKQTEVQAERVRIARELHDVLAHSLSQINVQAGVGLHLIESQPEKAADALASIKETSKTALDEVRSVLGVLRAEGGADPSAPLVPEPDLSRLGGLAASVTSQGVDVALTIDARDVPKAVQLAIYRIVQESLTNVVRHAGARSARVAITETDDAYGLEVTDDGTGSVASDLGGGRGLLGMRERAELLGGSLTAAPTGHGFRVAATIPKENA